MHELGLHIRSQLTIFDNSKLRAIDPKLAFIAASREFRTAKTLLSLALKEGKGIKDVN